MLLVKVALMILFIMWVRWTLPRFRYDQLMDLAWKSLIPLALVNLVATAAIVQLIYSSRSRVLEQPRANEFPKESDRCEPTTRN